MTQQRQMAALVVDPLNAGIPSDFLMPNTPGYDVTRSIWPAIAAWEM